MGTLTVSGAGRATIPIVASSVLNDNSWETISKVSQAGQAANKWAVGDIKTIIINGTIGATTFSNLSIDVFIIGFDHNSEIEGTNTIHFQIGKVNNSLVALYDSMYGSSESSSYFQMNPNYSNLGGWESSSMRSTILGNDGTPSAPPSNTFLAALPSDLLAVMKPVTKYSDNTGGANDTVGNVTATTDYLFLLSEYEYHGERTYANSAEQNFQARYDYYKAGNSRFHYKYDSGTGTLIVWSRSVMSSGSNSFCVVGNSTLVSSQSAYISEGISPAFVV